MVGNREECGFENEAECKVFARLGMPVVAALADAGSLLLGTNNSELLNGGRVEEFAIFVCGF